VAAAPSESERSDSEHEASIEDSGSKRKRRAETPTINNKKREAGPTDKEFRKRFKTSLEQLGGTSFFALRQEAEVMLAREIESEDSSDAHRSAREKAETSFEATKRRETDRVLRHMLESVHADITNLNKVKMLIERERGSEMTQFRERGFSSDDD
jgi:hypothetical protein